MVRFDLGDFVLHKNEKRNQTKPEPKFKGPLVITEILEGDIFKKKTLDRKRSYKDSHDRLRKMPDSCVPAELDVGSDGNNNDDHDDDGNDHDDMSTSIPEEP